MNCLFIFKSYNSVIYPRSIFLVYFTKMLLKYGLALPTESSNKLGRKRSKEMCNTGVVDFVWECHRLSQTTISVNWETQQTIMRCKPNMYLNCAAQKQIGWKF